MFFVASQTIEGKCYSVQTGNVTFWNGVSLCHGLADGADIVAVRNAFENSEIAGLVGANGLSKAYIGNVQYDGAPHWVSPNYNSTYSNWGTSSPIDGNAVTIDGAGVWTQQELQNTYAVVCQYYPGNPSMASPLLADCPSGWWASVSAPNKCLKWTNNDTNVFDAVRACWALNNNAELATISSTYELLEVTQGINFYYVGLERFDGQTWRWMGRHPTTYFGSKGTPSSGNIVFTMANGTFTGTDAYTDARYHSGCYYVCQLFPNETRVQLPSCPDGWTRSVTEPGKCYYMLSQVAYTNARTQCQNISANHGDLAVPDLQSEAEELSMLAGWSSNTPTWIGLDRLAGGWNWVTPENSTAQWWCSGQPDTAQNPTHKCAAIDPLGCWTSYDCTALSRAMCQIPAQPTAN